jgi:hypothetical protein
MEIKINSIPGPGCDFKLVISIMGPSNLRVATAMSFQTAYIFHVYAFLCPEIVDIYEKI